MAKSIGKSISKCKNPVSFMIIVLEYIRIKFNDIDYKQRSKQKGQCLEDKLTHRSTYTINPISSYHTHPAIVCILLKRSNKRNFLHPSSNDFYK